MQVIPSDKDRGRSVQKFNVPHKDLFPLDWTDFFGTLFVTIGLLIAASGGIGTQMFLMVPFYAMILIFRRRRYTSSAAYISIRILAQECSRLE